MRGPAPRRRSRPSAMRTTRPQRSASCESCVTSTSVACRRRCRPNSRSITCSPVLPSRLPVGSSARMICGRGLERAGDGHALLLAARELRREMIGAMRQADLGQQRARRRRRRRPGRRTRAAGRRSPAPSWSAPGGTTGTRCRCCAPRTSASSSSPSRHEIVAGDAHRARRGPLQAGDDHQQRGLAGAAGADDGDRFARRDGEIDALAGSRPGRRGWPASARRCARAMTGLATIPQQAPARGLASSFASFYVSMRAAEAHDDEGTHRCGQCHRTRRSANMVFRVLLCNWLIAAAAAAAPRRPRPGQPRAHRRVR